MRHQRNRLIELEVWVQKRSNVLRTLLTNLIREGQIMTTLKRAKVLRAYADHFFARLVGMSDKYDDKGFDRESIRYIKSIIWTESEGKKVSKDILPRLLSKDNRSWFVSIYKAWYRQWDGAEKVLVKIG